jgi:hypothetical protein
VVGGISQSDRPRGGAAGARDQNVEDISDCRLQIGLGFQI